MLVGATLNLKVVTDADVNSISHSTLSVVDTSYTDACTNWLPIEWVTGIEVKVPFPIVPLNVKVVDTGKGIKLINYSTAEGCGSVATTVMSDITTDNIPKMVPNSLPPPIPIPSVAKFLPTLFIF